MKQVIKEIKHNRLIIDLKNNNWNWITQGNRKFLNMGYGQYIPKHIIEYCTTEMMLPIKRNYYDVLVQISLRSHPKGHLINYITHSF